MCVSDQYRSGYKLSMYSAFRFGQGAGNIGPIQPKLKTESDGSCSNPMPYFDV